ncbi:Os06g0106650 [Oryza sativa Japonica Group]|uniref:Os06g0106650 protein n=1 Tax=Oryza sativa subsp. japonica TaxID=39947 RepID=A0A0P0WRH2_ORYSJ|nr:Os06g0106650 [Oryza sativa Japonica Group]
MSCCSLPKGLCVHVSKEHIRLDKMVRQKRSKLEDCSQSLNESDDIHSESLPNNDDNYQCDSSDNSDSNDMDVSQPHVNEISTNELLKTLKRKLSKSKRSEDDNIKMKRSESIELDNDVMINQVLRDIIQMDQIINNLKKKLNIHHNIGDQNLKVDNSSSSFADMLKSSVGDLLPNHEQDEEINDDVNQAVQKNNNITSSTKGNSKTVLDDDKLPIPNEEFNPVNKSTNLNSSEQITPRKLSQTFVAAVESPIICSDSPDKMYMVTLENSTSPTASLNENKENEKGCHMIKDLEFLIEVKNWSLELTFELEPSCFS